LFFLIFGFGVIALAALFMRLFRLRKAFSTSLDKNQKPTHTQKTKIKWDTADKDKYIELVNEGIQSSDLTLETAKDVEKAFLNLNSLINIS
jgi:hypothetical protein